MEADGKGLKVAYQVGARRNASYGVVVSVSLRLCLCFVFRIILWEFGYGV